ncbi:unnamed protein product [Brassica rapa subsp. narinosa]
MWRVYAVLVKGSSLYEIRKLRGGHSCSVDERAGYQRQATYSVIGEMLKQQFTGTGVGPRPGEIRQVMRGDHALGYLVSKAARAFRMGMFYETFAEISSINQACADYLIDIGLEHWTRSHFPGRRYNIMTSNLAESWNSVLRDAREYPIVPLVEFIRTKLMSWFTTRRDSIQDVDTGLTPKVNSILATNFEICGGYNVRKVDVNEYEVQDLKGALFVVNLADKSCSCFEFQSLSIPCSHAIAAALKANISVEGLVDEVYTMKYLKGAYVSNILPPIELDNTAMIASEVSALTLNPPATRRPPGRPRKKRFFSRVNMCVLHVQMKKIRKRYCSRCKGMGHNRATCKQAI